MDGYGTGKIDDLLTNHPEVTLVAIDNSNNNGGKIVSSKEASDWDYRVTEEIVYTLLKFIEDEYKQGKLDSEQLSSVGARIQEIKELESPRVQELANRIA